jgi:hypothetical protein
MLVEEGEHCVNAHDKEPSCNPMKLIAIVGACRVDPDGEINTDNESEA